MMDSVVTIVQFMREFSKLVNVDLTLAGLENELHGMVRARSVEMV
jgi:hypothetical protein